MKPDSPKAHTHPQSSKKSPSISSRWNRLPFSSLNQGRFAVFRRPAIRWLQATFANYTFVPFRDIWCGSGEPVVGCPTAFSLRGKNMFKSIGRSFLVVALASICTVAIAQEKTSKSSRSGKSTTTKSEAKTSGSKSTKKPAKPLILK